MILAFQEWGRAMTRSPLTTSRLSGAILAIPNSLAGGSDAPGLRPERALG